MADVTPTATEMKEGAARAKADDDLNRLRSDMDALRRDFGALAESLREIASARGQATADMARHTADDVQRRAQESLAAAQAHIEQRPLASVLIAFMVGLVMGKAMDRG